MSTALFDIGGTKTRVTVTRNGRVFRRPIVYKTPIHYSEGIRQLVDAIRMSADGWRVRRIVGVVAAPLDERRHRTVHASNLPGWYQEPLYADLRRRFSVPVSLVNDAAAAAVGEATRGAGKSAKIVAYLTVSTGVGGARIVDRRVDASRYGFEPGNMIVTPSAGTWATIEQLISGSGLRRRFRRAPDHIRDRRVWREVERTLAATLVNVAVLWSPDIIVLGGSIGRSRHLQLGAIRRYYRGWLEVFHRPPPICRGELGDEAGLWGALALAQRPR